MAQALKKIQDVEEINAYVKEKSGLKNSTALGGLLAANLANDNARVTALTAFVEKQKAAEKDPNHEKNIKAAPAAAMIAQGHEDVLTVMQIIEEQELNEKAAHQLIDDVKAVRTLETVKEQSVAHYSTPALQALQDAMDADAHLLKNLNLMSKDMMSGQAMAYSVEARKDISVREVEDQIQKMDLSTAENAAQSYQNLDQGTQIAKDLDQALMAVSTDGQEPTDVLQAGLVDEPEMDAPQAKQHMEENGANLIAFYKGQYTTLDQGDKMAVDIDDENADFKPIVDDFHDNEKSAFQDTRKEMNDKVLLRQSNNFGRAGLVPVNN